MPMKVTTTAAPTGYAYVDIRIGEATIHQRRLNAAALAGNRDADLRLPVGLPIKADGTPVTGAGQSAVALVGPEPVELGAVNVFGNTFEAGVFSRAAIEGNLGRVLSANELAALVAGAPAIKLA